MSAVLMGIRFDPVVRHAWIHGTGELGGSLPVGDGDGELDGRARILNVPSRVRVVVFERQARRPIYSTLSAPDGTWSVRHLNADLYFMVVGMDDRGLVNAAVQDWVKPHVPEP